MKAILQFFIICLFTSVAQADSQESSISETLQALKTNKNAVLCVYSDSPKVGVQRINDAIQTVEQSLGSANVQISNLSVGRTTAGSETWENAFCVLIKKL